MLVVSKNKKRKIILVLLAVLVIIGVLIKGIPASLLSSVFSRFISMGMKSEGRMELWVTYLHLCTDSIENLFFGSSIYGNDIFGRLDYNLHNSFLQMHNTYGLSLLTIFIIGTVVSLKNSYKRKQYLIVLLGITFFIRACLDQMGFAFFTEIYFYYFLFYSSFKYMMSEEKGGK